MCVCYSKAGGWFDDDRVWRLALTAMLNANKNMQIEVGSRSHGRSSGRNGSVPG